jgi:hypothetical protein
MGFFRFWEMGHILSENFSKRILLEYFFRSLHFLPYSFVYQEQYSGRQKNE